MSCEHWFGDDTFIPSRITYLRTRVAARTRADMQIRIRIERFDVVEYCEFVSGGNATGAAQATSGMISSRPAPAIGDTVMMRLAGDVDGVPFDESSRFDYGTMYSFPDAPSSSPAYLAQMRARIDLLIDVIANKVWDAELMRKGLAKK